jgi:hypothetical protein
MPKDHKTKHTSACFWRLFSTFFSYWLWFCASIKIIRGKDSWKALIKDVLVERRIVKFREERKNLVKCRNVNKS